MATNITLSAKDVQINTLDALNSLNGLAGDQANAEITALPNGDFVVVYENPFVGGTDHDIMAVEFTADGQIVGGGPYRLEFDGGDQVAPDVAPRLGGGIVAVWQDDANGNSISLAVVPPGAGPNPQELTVFNPGYDLYEPTVATYADGSYIVAWQSLPNDADIQFSRVNANGTTATAPVTVADPGNTFQGQARVATAGNQAMLVWNEGFTESRIMMELISSSGTASSVRTVAHDTFMEFTNPDVTGLADGRFVIVWEDAVARNIDGRIYDPASDTFSPVFEITHAGGDQHAPRVASLPDGGFMVTWTDSAMDLGDFYGTAIHARRFDSAGQPSGDEFRVNWGVGSDQWDSAVASDASGHVFAVWTNDDHNASSDHSGTGIQGRAMQTTTDPINGTPGPDLLTGYALGETINALDSDDVVHAGGGNDIIDGGGGNDIIDGGGGNDELHGDAGDDRLIGGTGADIMFGSAGDDIYIVDNTGDVVVEGFGQGIDAVGAMVDYTLPDNVERLVIAAPALNATGNGLDNIILGNAGNNVIDGGAGADQMAGRAGDDIYIVDNAGDVLVENPNEGSDTVKASIDYTLGANVENLVLLAGATNGTGNALNNTITGNAGNNLLTGGLGNDTIDGGAGDDTAVFSHNFNDYTVMDFGAKIMVVGPDGTDVLMHVEHLKFADTTITPVDDGDPLFDTLYYLSRNPDVFQAGVNAHDHFNASGWHEGRDPNPFFDTSGYLAVYKDVAMSGANPLEQYRQTGWHQGHDPSASFDTALYLSHNPDVAASGVNPLQQFLQSGFAEGHASYEAIGSNIVGGFDAEYYLWHNPDVAAAGVDPLQHFNTMGWHEGRNPNAWFDTAGYLSHYADVAASGVNPLQHYKQFGWHEGRDPSAQFDTLKYLAANPDVAAAGVNPLDHFLQNGIYENRSAMGDGMWH